MKTSIAFGGTQAGFGEMAWRRLSRVAAAFRHARSRRKAYNALAALDDRTLRDIGIDRREIWHAVDKALGEQPADPRAVRAGRSAQSIAA